MNDQELADEIMIDLHSIERKLREAKRRIKKSKDSIAQSYFRTHVEKPMALIHENLWYLCRVAGMNEGDGK